MTEYRIKKGSDTNQVRYTLNTLTRELVEKLELKDVSITVKNAESKRTLAMNAKMWAMLGDISRQVEWTVNSFMRLMKPEEWKIIFSASLDGVVKMSQGIDGGIVMMGQSTSKFTQRQISDLFEIMYAFGADKGVTWSEKSLQSYEDYPEFTR